VIAVYGATGYTGRLIVEELRSRGLQARLSGRSEAKLREIARDEEVRAAGLDDPAGLRAALEGCDAVVDAAGPFLRFGRPVVEAAVAAGVPYCDTSGEQAWIREVFDRHGPGSGVALVPAVGFDWLPGDLACALAAAAVPDVEEVVVAYAMSGGGASQGTLRSMLEALAAGDVIYEDGAWRPAPPGPFNETFDFPPPIGRRRMARMPSGEVITVPRHVAARRVRALVSARAFTGGSEVVAPAAPVLVEVIARALRTPLKSVLYKGVDRLPFGPDEEARRNARWTIVARATGTAGQTAETVVQGPDPYGLTAVMSVSIAERLASGEAGSGALAPAQVVDPAEFLDSLADRGVKWETRAPVAA
jgi:short subunit dehydrogenase-like uncharacterized protein